jgi:hypothetical protein
MENKSYIQVFSKKDGRIILDNLPTELYDIVEQSAPEFYERIDDNAWIMPIEYDNIQYQVAISRSKNSVESFMNGLLFAEDFLNATR